MEKYAVQIDPKKVEKEKLANKESQSQPATEKDAYSKGETNVPLDPVTGSLKYEKEPEPKKDADDKSK